MISGRIVIFSALYMPHLGGVEKFSQSIAAELAKDGPVTVFCMNTEKQPDMVCENGVEVIFLPCFSLQNGRFPVPKPSAVRILRNWFRQNSVAFGIVQCRFYLLSLLGCRILSKHRIPFIQIEHGAGDIVFSDPLVNRIWHLYDRLLTSMEKRIPHDYYAVSYAGLKWLEHYGIRGIGVISNSIDPADFEDALSHPGSWRKDHRIPADALIITFSGRIMREKGVIDLLEAFDRLENNGSVLVIAGGGDMESVRPWQGRENILFTGQIPFSEIPYLLADTAVYCLPSHFVEGKPTGVLEAGFCGNAVIAANSGGTTEIILDGRYGILIPSGDVSGLAEALRFLLENAEKRLEMGRMLHDRVLEEFTWKTAGEAVRKAMDRCLPE
ncbi:MAG: glycosyltransferase family 4 protein [Anaerolineaceae bacterium]|nr:glycosyltransferase family 4 protein [Anaerolineaceae bacterium]